MLIAQELDKRGYSSEEIEKIMGKNILRVLEEIWS
jgi:microsomal dipeptidase-like Zn-dependent dipeptidase